MVVFLSVFAIMTNLIIRVFLISGFFFFFEYYYELMHLNIYDNLLQLSLLLILKLSHLWPLGTSFNWHVHIVFVNCLVFWYDRIFIWIFCVRLPTWLILIHFLCKFWNHPFLQGTLALFSGKYYYTAKSGAGNVLCYWVFVFKPIQWTVLENTCY